MAPTAADEGGWVGSNQGGERSTWAVIRTAPENRRGKNITQVLHSFSKILYILMIPSALWNIPRGRWYSIWLLSTINVAGFIHILNQWPNVLEENTAPYPLVCQTLLILTFSHLTGLQSWNQTVYFINVKLKNTLILLWKILLYHRPEFSIFMYYKYTGFFLSAVYRSYIQELSFSAIYIVRPLCTKDCVRDEVMLWHDISVAP